MDYRSIATKWLEYPELDAKLKKELLTMSDEELEDSFSSDLIFGTGGLRGLLGVGTNRMNIYTVSKATYGYGLYLLNKAKDTKVNVVIAFDNRFMSWEFAIQSAYVLADMGIHVSIFSQLRSTPELSFSIRHLKASGGIMITASHNPKEYNGYKAYNSEGCQLLPHEADIVIEKIRTIDNYFTIANTKNRENITFIDKKLDAAYLSELKKIPLRHMLKKDIKIIYSPLHGTGSILMPALLEAEGYSVYPVYKEMGADPSFSCCKSANPEDENAYQNAMELCNNLHGQLIILTDPDCDRMGIAIPDGKQYMILSGNEIATLLVNYLLEFYNRQNALNNTYICYSLVSSQLPALLAKKYYVSSYQTLPGFKYIGEKIELMKDKRFLFGFEESIGYLINPFVRDKDAHQAALLMAEMTSYYHSLGVSLKQVLGNIYQEYGFFSEKTVSLSFPGMAGEQKIKAIMAHFSNPKTVFSSIFDCILLEDYNNALSYTDPSTSQRLTAPYADIIRLKLKDETTIIIRPSGTEPKLKIYYHTKDFSKELVTIKIDMMRNKIAQIIENIHSK